MRVPMKVDYGVRALIELTQQQGTGPVQTIEIAERQKIPEAYLEQLLSTLHKSGFIVSRRGPQGGHVLARDPRDVSLGMIVNTLEGTAAPLECFDEPHQCNLSDVCAQRDIWKSVEEAIQPVLNSTTIADLANRQNELSLQGSYRT